MLECSTGFFDKALGFIAKALAGVAQALRRIRVEHVSGWPVDEIQSRGMDDLDKRVQHSDDERDWVGIPRGLDDFLEGGRSSAKAVEKPGE